MMSNKKAFTLIELIFTIVIIGVLATIAIPKYQNLKDSAMINGISKIVSDAQSSIPSAFINAVDLNGEDPNSVLLGNIFVIKSKEWTYYEDLGIAQFYMYDIGNKNIVTISLAPIGRLMTITVQCDNLPSDTLKSMCRKKFPSFTASAPNQEIQL